MQSFFVSSTFKDMQGERDALHRTVMPRLREQAAKNGENIQFVDLRWGISTGDLDSSESTSKILSVCLQEVKNCKPYMIVLLGQRYGWIPPVEQIRDAGAQMDFDPEDLQISVTELEIRFGMYIAQGQLDRCIFCLREPVDESQLTQEQKNIYLSAGDEDARRMEALREKIRSTPGAHVITYSLGCKDGQFTGYEEFADRLYDSLESLLIPHWAARKQLTWQERQQEEDALTAENHLQSFVGREKTLQTVTDAIRYSQVVVLEGEGGCGKSALMAKVNQLYRRSNFQTELFFCGTGSGCMQVEQLMRLMLWKMDQVERMRTKEVESEYLEEYFRKRMQSYNGPVLLFFVDAIDQLAPDQALFETRFLPPEMSKSIRMIISTTGAVRVDPTALSGYTARKLRLEPPGEEELRTILDSRFAAEHKQVSKQVADRILQNPCSKNMLGMEIIVRRLLMLGQKDFDEIAQLEQTMGGAAAIDTYLLQLIDGLSSELNQLIIDYLFDVCRFLDGDSYRHSAIMLYMIGIMQHGLSPQELEELSVFLRRDGLFVDIPADHPFLHFWDPVNFARLKRYMGGLLVERSNGSIDLSHRLLRLAMRSSGSFIAIAPAMRCWLLELPPESNQRLENILPISRLTDDGSLRDGKPREQIVAQMDTYFCGPIRDAGNAHDDGDPEGTRRLEILIRSVIQDMTADDFANVAASYCRLLELLIADGASANHYTVWFFGTKIIAYLNQLGQEEKSGALRLISCLLSKLHDQKQAAEKGFPRYADNWTIVRKRRFLLFHCRALQMMADLRMDFRLGNVDLKFYDGLTAQVVFEKGLALAEECIREDPSYPLFYLRKAALYAGWSKYSADGANLGFGKNKQLHYAKEAFQCIEQALCLEMRDFFREYALYIIAICMEAFHMDCSGRLFGGKKSMDFANELCQKTWELVSAAGQVSILPTDSVARFILSWSKCLDARGDVLSESRPGPWRQRSLELCAEHYMALRQAPERIRSAADRRYQGLLGVQACLMMLQGYPSQVMQDAGYSGNQALRYISAHELGYFRAEARRDFEGRWSWAILLCAEAHAVHLHPTVGVENMDRALDLLKELQNTTEHKGYAVDISHFRIERMVKQAQELHQHYRELLPKN